jgi:hypothetical protein
MLGITEDRLRILVENKFPAKLDATCLKGGPLRNTLIHFSWSQASDENILAIAESGLLEKFENAKKICYTCYAYQITIKESLQAVLKILRVLLEQVFCGSLFHNMTQQK